MENVNYNQFSVDPENVPVKGWTGRIMFHGTSKIGGVVIYNAKAIEVLK